MILEQDASFVGALEECCQRVKRGEPLERCLADYPDEYHEELARLVPLAGHLRTLARDPSPQFQGRLEQRLLREVEKARVAQQVGLQGRICSFFTKASVMRFAVAALVVMIVFVGAGVGAIQASESSLPDSPLYQVKAAREWAEVMLARNGEAQVGVHARQIAERGRELERAVQLDKPLPVIEVLALRLAASTDRIIDKVVELHARGNVEPARRTLVAINAMERYVDRLSTKASPSVKPRLERLQGFLEGQEQRLLRLNLSER